MRLDDRIVPDIADGTHGFDPETEPAVARGKGRGGRGGDSKGKER